jgi:hypothetical protein
MMSKVGHDSVSYCDGYVLDDVDHDCYCSSVSFVASAALVDWLVGQKFLTHAISKLVQDFYGHRNRDYLL